VSTHCDRGAICWFSLALIEFTSYYRLHGSDRLTNTKLLSCHNGSNFGGAYNAFHIVLSGGMMRRISRWLLPAAAFFISSAWIPAGGQHSAPSPSPQTHSVMATRLYTGPDGQSHIDQVPIVLHGAPTEESAPLKMSDAYIVRGAPGMFEPPHNADRKRYIVVICGEAEVTTTSGEKARILPGQVYLAEDLTGKGHTFRVVGNQEWVALFVNFAQ
jgi:hypothetical protein